MHDCNICEWLVKRRTHYAQLSVSEQEYARGSELSAEEVHKAAMNAKGYDEMWAHINVALYDHRANYHPEEASYVR